MFCFVLKCYLDSVLKPKYRLVTSILKQLIKSTPHFPYQYLTINCLYASSQIISLTRDLTTRNSSHALEEGEIIQMSQLTGILQNLDNLKLPVIHKLLPVILACCYPVPRCISLCCSTRWPYLHVKSSAFQLCKCQCVVSWYQKSL